MCFVVLSLMLWYGFVNGCMKAVNMEGGCNESNYAELIYTVSDLANADSNPKGGDPKIAFYDKSDNLLDEFYVGRNECDWYE